MPIPYSTLVYIAGKVGISIRFHVAKETATNPGERVSLYVCVCILPDRLLLDSVESVSCPCRSFAAAARLSLSISGRTIHWRCY